MNHKLAVALTAVCATLLIFAVPAGAAPGDLDPTFGVGGVVADPTPLDTAFATWDIAIQPSGKVLAAGTESGFGSPTDAVVQRFSAGGSVDLAFGGGDGAAKVIVPSSYSSAANAVHVLPDGSILLAGTRVVTISPYVAQFLLIKLTPEGELDTTFDGDGANACTGNGIVCTQVSASAGQDSALAIDVQTDGDIVLAGSAYVSVHADFGVARYTSTGALDSSFSGDGKLVLSVGFSANYARAVMVKPNQQILVAGVARALAPDGAMPPVARNADDIGLALLNTDGSPDPAFDGDGENLIAPSAGNGLVIVTPRAFQTYGAVYDATLAPDGKIVITGYANDNTPTPTASSNLTIRFDANGSLDHSFGSGGRVLLDTLPGYNFGYAVQVDSAGRPMILGSHPFNANYQADVTRLRTDGSLDPTWSGGGTRFLSFGGDATSLPSGALIQPDGKLVVGANTSPARSGIARLLTADAPPIPPPPLLTPTVKIKSPASKSVKASKLKSIAGTAGPTGSVKKVEIALRRIDAKLLSKSKKCAWLSSGKAKFKSVKATKKKCAKPYFRAATGTTNWKYKLTKKLPVGKYELSVRVTLTDGTTQTTFTKKAGNFLAFKLK
jgi:uncharacterized delta-60 repeat protein